MVFTLTIGEVIDKLEIGEYAINQNGDRIGYSEKGDLLYMNDGVSHSEDKFSVFYYFAQKDRWKIVSPTISFQEAMNALEEGAIVEFGRFRFNKDNQFVLSEMGQFGLTFRELFEGEWTLSKKTM